LPLASLVSIVNVVNSGANSTKQIHIGDYGSITFNDKLIITNNSTANNSKIYLNRRNTSSNTYNDDIIVESTNTNSDGISFGEYGGSATLAAGKTISIGSNGFISGDLRFRNFTQLGSTPQTLVCTGTARIYNYDSNWGGDVHFVAPRIITRGTIYNRTAYLEKTGAEGDNSAGGNIFKMNTELKNTGSGYLSMGTTIPDTCLANLTINNEGSYRMYYAYRSAGNYIAGNLTINNNFSNSSLGEKWVL